MKTYDTSVRIYMPKTRVDFRTIPAGGLLRLPEPCNDDCYVKMAGSSGLEQCSVLGLSDGQLVDVQFFLMGDDAR